MRESGVEPELNPPRFLLSLSFNEVEESRRGELVGLVQHSATTGFLCHRHFAFRLGFPWRIREMINKREGEEESVFSASVKGKKGGRGNV